MRTSFVWIFIIIFFTISLLACKRKPNVVAIQASWKSTDPTAIPLLLREKELNKGNLVLNSSFEDGRYYKVDSFKNSFNLRGWKKVGENVFWTDVQNEKEFDPSEAFSGLHAIKIYRKNTNETDTQGEGILSDFIKIIPGNYTLSYQIRLDQVRSSLSRMINTLYDAVNIKVFFYDKNKILLNSSMFNPSENNFIDNSFKGFSFSGISYVDKMDWGKVIGKTANYPFNNGDLPDGTHYVKIFLGLKGKGTMWVDAVNFEYSPKNFSLLERTEPMFDSIDTPASKLIPYPHLISNYSPEILRLTINDKNLDPIILIPPNADKGILLAAKNISNHIGEAIKGNDKKHVSILITNKL